MPVLLYTYRGFVEIDNSGERMLREPYTERWFLGSGQVSDPVKSDAVKVAAIYRYPDSPQATYEVIPNSSYDRQAGPESPPLHVGWTRLEFGPGWRLSVWERPAAVSASKTKGASDAPG